MKDVVAEFPPDQQAALKPALDSWRYPYWDWALPRQGTAQLYVPELLRLPKIDVRRSNGLTETIDNPLYRYQFPLNSRGKIDGISDTVLDNNGNFVPVCVIQQSRFPELC